uniref:NADH-ubiquinone oxidoreductase chain 4 n=1 Tax=Tigriopus japonicus TaxID=158387 RepID=Q8M6U6_TIGJA|nr:NADH dehydrogenase subunit 4 [Tigriopus japonicus]
MFDMFSMWIFFSHPVVLILASVLGYFKLLALFSGSFVSGALLGEWFVLDDMGFYMLLLNKLIFILIILGGTEENKVYTGVVYAMGILVGCCFQLHSVFIFYVYFEVSLLPMVLLILGWGYQPERLSASKYLLLYTIFFSFPLLMYIVSAEMGGSGSSFSEWACSGESVGLMEALGSLALLGGFLVKIPLYGIHLWLPKAHVEASSGGSMILAAVLLKLGGIGIWRVLPVVQGLGASVSVLVSLGLYGGAMVSMICLGQSDLKLLVAYSSVSHMSLVVWGLLSNSTLGSYASLMMMVAHGFASSGLFYSAGIFFKEAGSRSLLLNQGLLGVVPGFAVLWFVINCLSMATPPSMNFFSEVEVLVMSYSLSTLLWLSVLVMAFFSVAYSMLCYTTTSHGRSSSVSRFCEINGSEQVVLGGHALGSFVILVVMSGL